MTLRKRLDRLEAKLGGDRSDPLVMVFRVVHAKGPVHVTGAKADLSDIKAEAPAQRSGFSDAIEAGHSPSDFAIIGAGPHGEATNLKRLNGEAEAAFCRAWKPKQSAFTGGFLLTGRRHETRGQKLGAHLRLGGTGRGPHMTGLRGRIFRLEARKGPVAASDARDRLSSKLARMEAVVVASGDALRDLVAGRWP